MADQDKRVAPDHLVKQFEPISLVFSPDFPDPDIAGHIATLDPKDHTGPTAKTVWTIGKSSKCDVVVGRGNAFFSRIHASILLRDLNYYILDGGVYGAGDSDPHPSTNGVYVGKDRIYDQSGEDCTSYWVKIEPGTKITLGLPDAKIMVGKGEHTTVDAHVWNEPGWAEFIPKLYRLPDDVHEQLVNQADTPVRSQTMWSVLADMQEYIQEEPHSLGEAIWKLTLFAFAIILIVVGIKYILPLFN